MRLMSVSPQSWIAVELVPILRVVDGIESSAVESSLLYGRASELSEEVILQLLLNPARQGPEQEPEPQVMLPSQGWRFIYC